MKKNKRENKYNIDTTKKYKIRMLPEGVYNNVANAVETEATIKFEDGTIIVESEGFITEYIYDFYFDYQLNWLHTITKVD